MLLHIFANSSMYIRHAVIIVTVFPHTYKFYFAVSTTCKCSWIDSHRQQTKWRSSGFRNVLIFSILWWELYKEQEVTCLPTKSTVQNSGVTDLTNMSELWGHLVIISIIWSSCKALFQDLRRYPQYSVPSHNPWSSREQIFTQHYIGLRRGEKLAKS